MDGEETEHTQVLREPVAPDLPLDEAPGILAEVGCPMSEMGVRPQAMASDRESSSNYSIEGKCNH